MASNPLAMASNLLADKLAAMGHTCNCPGLGNLQHLPDPRKVAQPVNKTKPIAANHGAQFGCKYAFKQLVTAAYHITVSHLDVVKII